MTMHMVQKDTLLKFCFHFYADNFHVFTNNLFIHDRFSFGEGYQFVFFVS